MLIALAFACIAMLTVAQVLILRQLRDVREVSMLLALGSELEYLIDSYPGPGRDAAWGRVEIMLETLKKSHNKSIHERMHDIAVNVRQHLAEQERCG